MKYSFLFALLCLYVSVAAQSLQEQWSWQIGGSGLDTFQAIEQLPNGNYVTCGFFGATMSADPIIGVTGNDLITAGSIRSGFVSIYSPSGAYVNSMEMTDDDPVPTTDIRFIDLAVSDDRIWVLGYFNNASGPSEEIFSGNWLINSNGGWDYVLLVLDHSLNVLSVRTGGLVDNDFASDIELDMAGNAWITGYRQINGGSNTTLWLRQYDTNYSIVSDFTFGTMENILLSAEMKFDDSGNLYYAGMFAGALDYDNDGNSDFVAPSRNFFLSKYDASMSHLGTEVWGESNNNDEFLRDVTIDNDGNVIVAGDFSGTIDFNPDPNDQLNLTAITESDVFVSSFNSSLEHISTQRLFGTGASSQDETASVCVDDCNNIQLLGKAESQVTNGVLSSQVNFTNDQDIFVATYANNGGNLELSELNSFGGSTSEFPRDIMCVGEDNAAQLIMLGDVYEANVFNSAPGVYNGSYGGDADMFLAKFGMNGSSDKLNGCTDPNACNYSSAAIYDDGSCDYPDEDNDGVADCFDNCPCNSNPDQAPAADSCLGETRGAACTDSDDDGLTDATELAYGTNPLNPVTFGSCEDIHWVTNQCCPSDLNNDTMISAADLLIFLADFGTDCTP